MRLFMLDAQRLSEADIRLVRTGFPKRYERAARCLRTEDRLACLAAGLLLRVGLGVSEERQLRFSPAGRPWLPGGPEFSLSHSGGRCVLAVSERRVGVDLERLDESNLIAAPAALTERELAWIEPAPLERFHLLWTRKESVYKALGGFTDPKQIEVPAEQAPAGFFLKSRILDGFALSVCAEEEIGSLEPEEL